MQAKYRHQGGRRQVVLTTAVQVPCDKATEKRPHYVHLAVDQHQKIMQLRTTCAVDNESKAIRRLGGVSCSNDRVLIRRYLKRHPSAEWVIAGEWPKHLIHLRPVLERVGRSARDHREYVEQEKLLDYLRNKFLAKVAGFPLRIGVSTGPLAGHLIWEQLVLARKDGRQWRFDEEECLKTPLHFNSRRCPVCPEYASLDTRSRPAHERGKLHRERCLEAVRRAVKFLNGLGRTR